MIEPNTIGDVIDLSDEDFNKFLSTKDFGYLLSVKNLLLVTYGRVCEAKDGLVNEVKSKDIELTKEAKHTIEGLFHKLMCIEYKVSVIDNLMKSRISEN